MLDATKRRSRWVTVLMVVAMLMVVAVPAMAGNTTTVMWTTDGGGDVMAAEYRMNPNGLIHQWRHPGSEAGNGATHLVFQPVGDKWPAADCKTDDPGFITSIGPWRYTASRYNYQGGPAAPLTNGAYYWVCFYG